MEIQKKMPRYVFLRLKKQMNPDTNNFIKVF